jgi:hypothetical protein
MTQDPAAAFVRTLAAAVLREGEPDALARDARQALDGVFAAQKSLVLDVQFTGFAAKGQAVGGISPELLRGAGQLIMMRVSRVGFTPEVRDEDLAAFFELAARGPGEIGPGGIMAAVREAAPRGIYVSTSGGETYRPAPAPRPAPSTSTEAQAPVPPAAAEAPQAPQATVEATPLPTPSPEPQPSTPVSQEPAEAPEPETLPEADLPSAGPPSEGEVEEPAAPSEPLPAASPDLESVREETPAPAPEPAAPHASTPSAFGFDEVEEGMAFTDFEVLEAFPEAGPAVSGPSTGMPGDGGSGVGSGDMYHFFRASHGQVDPEAAELPRLLATADSLSQFDEVAQGCARAAARLVSTDQHAAALDVLEALMTEAERPDRTRVFREGAVQALRRAGTEQTLHGFVDYIQQNGTDRDRVVRLFLFLGGDTVALLDGLLFRTVDPELRTVLFRRLAAGEGGSQRLLARTMTDPAPGRTRAMLELAATCGLDGDLALRWVADAATHADSTVRMDAARHAAALGGRGGLRVLVDLLSDADRLVKRAAINGLGTLGDAAAVPFLARVLNDTSDEDVQMAIIVALGKIGSHEALPTLVNVVNKRQLFSGRKLVRVKIAALTAISRLPGASAREVLTGIAGGKDGELAPEARRLLALMD